MNDYINYNSILDETEYLGFDHIANYEHIHDAYDYLHSGYDFYHYPFL